MVGSSPYQPQNGENIPFRKSTYPPASILDCRHGQSGEGGLIAVETGACEQCQCSQCSPPDLGGEGLSAVGVKHPALVHQHGLEGIALQEGQTHPQAKSLKPKHHRDSMVAMETNAPERKRGSRCNHNTGGLVGSWGRLQPTFGIDLKCCITHLTSSCNMSFMHVFFICVAER